MQGQKLLIDPDPENIPGLHSHQQRTHQSNNLYRICSSYCEIVKMFMSFFNIHSYCYIIINLCIQPEMYCLYQHIKQAQYIEKLLIQARHLHSLIKPDHIIGCHGDSMGASYNKVLAGWLVAMCNNSSVSWGMVWRCNSSCSSAPFWSWLVKKKKKKSNYSQYHRMHTSHVSQRPCCFCDIVQVNTVSNLFSTVIKRQPKLTRHQSLKAQTHMHLMM